MTRRSTVRPASREPAIARPSSASAGVAAGDGLDRVEGSREIEPGHDRAGRLGLRDEPQGERRPAAREVTPERQAEPTGQATRPEDRVEVGEAGREETSDRGPAELASVLGERVGILA